MSTSGEKTHTPAPWKVAREKIGDDEYSSQIVGDIFVLADLSGPNYPHQAANARLIAAAPELLGALENLLADCEEYSRINNLHNEDGSPATNHAMRRAAVAIALATPAEGERTT